ncbi:MAG: nitroreductase family deazaflavin-dependent oxidoreductase [Deltaproteobacteria bacterium]|nr:nitroreductase family deazaflavin-dependent oxidoreductase [Deltaproteobacteria bacterium]
MKEARPFSATEVAIAKPVIRVMSRLNTWAYRLSGGRLFGKWIHGEPIALVTVTGRKTGRALTVPLVYLRDGDRLVLVASKGGMDQHPLWYLNMRAHPDVEVQIGQGVRRMRARTADGAERAHYWPKLVALNRDFDQYQARARPAREIPVVILSPA